MIGDTIVHVALEGRFQEVSADPLLVEDFR